MTKKNDNNIVFIIGVGDLLHKPGTKDTFAIPLDSIAIANISHIIGKAEIVAISEFELVLTLSLQFEIVTICDYCGKDQIIKKSISHDVYNFVREGRLDEDTMREQELYPIPNDMSLDLYPIIRQSVLLSDFASHVCEDCQKRLATKEQSDDEDEEDHVVGRVVFN